MQFWSRLSCAVSLSRRDDTDELQLYISNVFSSLCDAIMIEVPKNMGGQDCDPCDGLETLLDHVETVQTMSRVKYDATAFTVCQRMDAQLDLLQAVAATGNFTPAAMAAEGCLAWLTYFVSSIIQGRRPPEDDERYDAELTLRVLRVMQWLEVREQRLPQAPVGVKVLERLELAVLHFLSSFRRTYVGDQPTASCVTLFKGEAAAQSTTTCRIKCLRALPCCCLRYSLCDFILHDSPRRAGRHTRRLCRACAHYDAHPGCHANLECAE